MKAQPDAWSEFLRPSGDHATLGGFANDAEERCVSERTIKASRTASPSAAAERRIPLQKGGACYL